MALRNRYGANFQTINTGGIGELLPVGYVEVVPGETVSGPISAFVRSVPANQQEDNRMYLDMYAFYVPFRVLDPNFPKFVAQQEGGVIPTVPVVTNLMPRNFEKRFSISIDGNVTFTQNTAWQRRMYNWVYYKYFHTYEQDLAGNENQNNIQTVFQRPSTLETRVYDRHIGDQLIPLTGTSPNQTVSVQALREGLAQDSFQKMRAFYGDRYVDYLAALGVRAGWTLLDEPELLCQHHTDWKFRTIANTTDVAEPPATGVLGQTKGYFASAVTCSIKNAFLPEHGLIGVYVVTRGDPVFQASAMNPVLAKTAASQYWSPERTNLRVVDFQSRLFQAPADTGFPALWRYPLWEEHRVGINQDGLDEASTKGLLSQYAMFYPQADQQSGLNKFRQLTAAGWAANFSEADELDNFQMSVATNWRLVRQSPVARSDIRLKLS